MFCVYFVFTFLFLTISVRSVISTSTGPIFATFSVFVDEMPVVSLSLLRRTLPRNQILSRLSPQNSGRVTFGSWRRMGQ